MKKFLQSIALLLLLQTTAWSQTVSSVVVNPNPAYPTSNLSAMIQGQFLNSCVYINAAWASLNGSTVSLYIDFNTTGGNCLFVVSPYMHIVGIGTLPAGTYTLNTYNYDTGALLNATQFIVYGNGLCQAPGLSQLSATNLAATTARINTAVIPGATHYEFRYRATGAANWTTLPVWGNPYRDLNGLTPCTMYEFQVRAYCGGGTWTTFSVSRTFTTVCGTANNCSNPALLTCGTPFNSSTAQGTNNFTSYFLNGVTTFGNMIGKEMVHRFTLTAPTNVNITLTGLSANLDLLLLYSCNNTSLTAYSSNSGTTNEQITINNLPAGTYTVIVDGGTATTSNYSLLVQCGGAPPSCNAPLYGQVSVTNLTDWSARLQTSVVATQYRWTYRELGEVGWPPVETTTTNYFDIYFLDPDKTYEFIVSYRCSNGQWSAWSQVKNFTTVGMTGGTSCTNYIPTSCGSIYYGNTTNGGSNYSMYIYNNQQITEPGRERIYRFVQAVSGPFQATLSNLSENLDLFLIANCNAMTVVARSLASGLNNEVISLPYLPAGTYQIVIDSWGPTGSYALHLPCTASGDNPCTATPLSVGFGCSPIAASNIGSTNTTTPSSPVSCSTSGMNDVWFSLTIPGTGVVRVTTASGSLIDASIAVYSGLSCSSLGYVACFNDTDGDFMPDITISGAPGTKVYLRIWGNSGAVGTFSICATAVTSLTASNDADVQLAVDDRDAAFAPAGALRLFPVPAGEVLNISADGLAGETSVSVRILSLSGQIMQEETLPADDLQGEFSASLAVQRLPAGLYIVQLRAGSQVLMGQFSKL